MTKVENVVERLELLKQRLILQADVLGYGYHISDIDNALELLKAKDINVPTKWVSVKDRLPKENEAVNVVWVNHNPASYYQHIKDKPLVATAVYYDGRWYWWNTTISDYLNEYGHVEFDRIDEGIEITHWQNLPKPPKEDEA